MAPEGGSASARRTFQRVITEAVADLEVHGYDSQQRLEFWLGEIRRAAIEAMTPPHLLEKALNETLLSIYRRLIENGQIVQLHPGVARFTIERVRPQLRAALDRRIMASANLIKLNREQAIAKTVQRFSGWATSIPAGGSEAVERREVKKDIRKALAQLPFEERRVLIDQGHKLRASLSEILAVDGGAVALIWRSHWRQAGYNYRVDHKERDGKVYTLRGNWAIERGLMKAGPAGYYDDITAVGEEIFCLPGDARIPFADGVEIAYRRWYSGDLAELLTASGKAIRGTPNHPVLTPNGWVAMGALKEGDHLIEVAEQIVDPAKQDRDSAVPLISQVFGALKRLGIAEKRCGQREQFHGDGSEGDIDIVRAARPLNFGRIALRTQGSLNLDLSEADEALAFVGPLDRLFSRGFAPTPRFMSGMHEFLAALDAFTGHSQEVGVASAAKRSASRDDMSRYDRARDAEFPRDGEYAFAGLVAMPHFSAVKSHPANHSFSEIQQSHFVPHPNQFRTDIKGRSDLLDRLPFGTQASRIVEVKRHWFSGRVFNLQTVYGWYIANGIITHNCRCYATYLYALRDLPDAMLTQKGRAALDAAKREIAA